MDEFDPYSEEFLEDPRPSYEWLRENEPVYRHETLGAFFLSRFDDIWSATQSRKLSVARGITPSQLLLGAEANPLMPSQMDAPRHTQVRSVLSPHFRPAPAGRPALRARGGRALGRVPLLPRGARRAPGPSG